MLVIMPIYLLQDIGLTHHQRILVISAFCASLLITVIAIPLSVSLFVNSISDTTLILGHVKVCSFFCFLTLAYHDMPIKSHQLR